MQTLDVYELEELFNRVHEQIDGKLMEALSFANRSGELRTLLQLLLMEELIAKDGEPIITPTRVLVVGDGSYISEGKLREIIRKSGLEPKLFDIKLGYDELKHLDFGRLRNSYTYKAVMFGAMPHSVPGKREASSIITQMESQPEIYPPVIRLNDSNKLKITKNSFLKGLEELSHLP